MQETMLRACRKWDQYEPGTNVRAWLMTIIRNYYINTCRTARQGPVIVEIDDASRLSDVDGLPIARIAEVLDVPVGTVKSRVHRARRRARERLRHHAVELGVVGADQD